MRDRFGNMIDPISVRCPPPLLSVEWSGDDGTGGPVSVWAADDDPAGAEMCPLTVTDQNGSAEWAVDIALSVGSVGIWTPDNRPIWQDGIFALGTTHGISARKRIAGSNNDMAQQRGVLQCYVAAKAISFRSRVESASGIPIKITLFDAGHHFQSHSIHSFLVPGLPFQLLLKCPDLIINEFTESLAASVTSTRELDTIEAKFVDQFGNDATVGAIKTCKVMN